jgi:hypothetical protein
MSNPDMATPAPLIRIRDMHYTGQGWSHAFFNGEFYTFSDGDQYTPEAVSQQFEIEAVTEHMLDEQQMRPDQSSLAGRLEACEDVLRRIASSLGNGGYNAPVVDAKVFEKKIMDGIASFRRVKAAVLPSSKPTPEAGSNPDLNLKKRTWCYAHPPASFEVDPCSCGNTNTQWSEFEGHLWCASCQKDFKPKHSGIFSGPIPIELATRLGLSFDRIDLATGEIQKLDPDSGKYLPIGAD